MKRNLLPGIVFISAIALSSCSINKLAGNNTTGDDVYFTKAIAGDNMEYADAGNRQQNNYRADDDYYYYGDYASRINRFAYNTPFDYDDEFYYTYTPYSRYGTTTVNTNYNSNYVAESPYNDFGVYSPYDFGYADVGGYDNFGYGAAYSTFITTGSGRFRHNGNRQFNRAGYTGGGSGSVANPGSGLTFTRANAGGNITAGGANRGYANGNNVIFYGRPTSTATTVVIRNGNNATRAIRTDGINRPASQQVTERSAPQSVAPSNTSSSSGSSSSTSNSGGGGRPVRP